MLCRAKYFVDVAVVALWNQGYYILGSLKAPCCDVIAASLKAFPPSLSDAAPYTSVIYIWFLSSIFDSYRIGSS